LPSRGFWDRTAISSLGDTPSLFQSFATKAKKQTNKKQKKKK
jgi:hypothetical protein